ncbi:MAG: hypothetical protein WC464_03530 [Bdellovibrionales bacterium]
MTTTSELFEQIVQDILALDGNSYHYEGCPSFPSPEVTQYYNVPAEKQVVRVTYSLPKVDVGPEKTVNFHAFIAKMNRTADYFCDVASSEEGFSTVFDKIRFCTSDYCTDNILPPFKFNHRGEIEVLYFEVPFTENTAAQIRAARVEAAVTVGNQCVSDALQRVDLLISGFPEEDGNNVRKRLAENSSRQTIRTFFPK